MAHEEVPAKARLGDADHACCCAGLEPHLCPCVAVEGTHAGESYLKPPYRFVAHVVHSRSPKHAMHSWSTKHTVHDFSTDHAVHSWSTDHSLT